MISGVILFFASQYYVHVNCGDDSMVMYRQSPVILLLGIGLVALLVGLHKLLAKVKPSVLFGICISVYIILGLLLVFLADAGISDDPGMVHKYLEYFLTGDFHGIT